MLGLFKTSSSKSNELHTVLIANRKPNATKDICSRNGFSLKWEKINISSEFDLTTILYIPSICFIATNYQHFRIHKVMAYLSFLKE